MNRLPGAAAAIVPPRKVTDYLLNLDHARGRHKALFFLRRGFDLSVWQHLAKALCRHPQLNDVVTAAETEFGQRWRVERSIETPDGSNPCIVTVWQTAPGTPAPMLITAFPR